MKQYNTVIIGAFLTALLSYGYPGVVMGNKEFGLSDGNNEMLKAMDKKPSHHTATGFQNYPPIPTAAPKGIFFYLRRFWGSIFLPRVPDEHALAETEALQLLDAVQGNSITWLGHASFLIRIAGKTILTDPFLTEFASPVSWAGPRRYVPPGIPLEKLPSIDIMIVSHNHYDHLDDETIKALPNKEKIQVVVPLGLKPFFAERGYLNVNELDWGEQATIDELTLIALPAVHDSARSTNDHNKTLWASWAVISARDKLYFIGDSGYSKTIFEHIGHSYGPFDYALVPISAYEPRKLMWMSHITPEEAVTIGKVVGAKTLIASHWGTVNLSDEPPWEPPGRFSKAGLASGWTEDTLWIMKIGETRPL